MIVQLTNDWFDGFTLHRKGRIEYNGDPAKLPSKAVVLSEKGFPVESTANTPKPGFGAKPAEEQVLDLIGAGPTHQIDVGPDAGGITPAPDNPEKDEKDAEKEKAEADAAQQKQHDEDVKDAKADLAKALPLAEEAAKQVQKATDPLFPAEKPKK